MSTAMVLIQGADNDLTLNRYIQGKFDSRVTMYIEPTHTITDIKEIVEDYRVRGIPAEA